MDDEEKNYTLEETIQNYYTAMNSGWEEDDYQMLAWLEELQDLRKILTKTPPEELLDELTDENGPISLECILEEFDDIAAQDSAEHIVHFWLKQLSEAQKRIEKNTIL